MPSDLHARARRILRLLYEKSPDRWDALIHDQCGEDTELRDLVLGLIRTAPQTADKLLPDTEFRPGSSLGDYQLVRRLGPGTMGEVWLAWEERLGRLVCLKFLPATFRKDADRVARFNREAHALAKINHPNIVTLHGRKKIDGVDFLEMEFVVGEPLGTLRKITGRSQYERAIWIARQLIDAMSAAHGMGVLHRDLKPHNVLICDTDHVVVLDFGLTRYEGVEDLTLAGEAIGTFHYGAPEQLKGGSSKASDVYSIGVIIFELLTGARPPLVGQHYETDKHALHSLIRKTYEDAPPEVAALVSDCLAPEALDRIPDATTLLDRFQKLPQLDFHLGPRRSRFHFSGRERALTIAGLFVLATALGTVGLFRMIMHPPGPWLSSRLQSALLLLAAYVSLQLGLNLLSGRPLMRPARLFSAKNRVRIATFRYVIQLVGIVLTGLVMIDRSWLLSRGSEIAFENHWLHRILPSVFPTLDKAQQFLEWRGWDVALALGVLLAVWTAYRKWVEAKILGLNKRFFVALAHLQRLLHRTPKVDRPGVWETGIQTCLSIATHMVAADPLVGLIGRLFANRYIAYLLIPSDEGHFETVGTYSDDPILELVAQEVRQKFRPRELDLPGLVKLYNACLIDRKGGYRFDRQRFDARRDEFVSASGIVFALERPKIFQVASSSLALTTGFQNWTAAKERELSTRIAYRSFLLGPLKLGGRVLGVYVIGATRPRAFAGATTDILEKLGRCLAEALVSCCEFEVLRSANNDTVDVLARSKFYEAPDRTRQRRITLRRLTRRIRTGGMHGPLETQDVS